VNTLQTYRCHEYISVHTFQLSEDATCPYL